MEENLTVLPAREGVAVPLRAGERLRIINTHGGQVVDTWALARADVREYLSMEHTRTSLGKLVPAAGDHLYSSRRRPLLTLTEDTSPGVHDTLIAACDHERYRQLGADGYHANCADNFRQALSLRGIEPDRVPAPLNLFMNVAWANDGRLEFLPSPARAGDYVTVAAETDVTVVLSACPMDLNPINTGGPQEVALEILPVQ
ncbi:MAG: DUF1989 domain-containing protein [Solirubrobacteraceae bacterium]